MFNFKSYYDLSRDVASGIQKVPNVDVVVGVPKSGVIPACMIASFLNLPYYDLDSFCFSFSPRSGTRKIRKNLLSNNINVLIVDDSVNTGTEMRAVKQRLKSLRMPYNFVFCAIYSASPKLSSEVDLFFSFLPQPRVFQWNYRNHIISEYSAYDMDGVLCVDPTDEENDDGEKYIRFIKNADPLFIPKKNISAIVTSRLERYRPQTEEWLAENNVRYDELIMLDLPSAEERRRLGIHASFKAEVYKERSDILFVESNWKQAKKIAELADKPVICTENDAFLYGRDHLKTLTNTRQLFSYERLSSEEGLRAEYEKLAKRFRGVSEEGSLNWKLLADGKIHKEKINTILPKENITNNKNKRRMKVALIGISFDNKIGAGAATSSLRLKKALESHDIDVHAISMSDIDNFKVDSSFQPKGGTFVGYWNSYVKIEHSNSIKDKINKVDPDVIVLGAVDRGIVSLFDIASMNYPIVWIARDNWLHTGGCLFQLGDTKIQVHPGEDTDFFNAISCGKYTKSCDKDCPAIKNEDEKLISEIQFSIKSEIYAYRSDIVFAPISKWAERCLKSARLTKKHEIIQAYNPVDLYEYKPLEGGGGGLREKWGLPKDKKLALISAHKLGNLRKGVQLLYDGILKEEFPENIHFVFMGIPSLSDIPDEIKVRSHFLGFIESDTSKVEIYNAVDVTVVASIQESLSVVASDSISCGTPVVAFSTGGLTELIVHKKTGYLATPFDSSDIINGVRWVCESNDHKKLRVAARERAEELLDQNKNIQEYINIFKHAISKFQSRVKGEPSLFGRLESFLSTFEAGFKKDSRQIYEINNGVSNIIRKNVIEIDDDLVYSRHESSFSHANKLYNRGDYQAAISIYEKLYKERRLEMYKTNILLAKNRMNRCDK